MKKDIQFHQVFSYRPCTEEEKTMYANWLKAMADYVSIPTSRVQLREQYWYKYTVARDSYLAKVVPNFIPLVKEQVYS